MTWNFGFKISRNLFWKEMSKMKARLEKIRTSLHENLDFLKNKKLKEAVLDTFFPKTCFSCNKNGKYVCDECSVFLGEASLICPVCGNSSFTGQKHFHCSARYGLDGLVGVWEYEGITKTALREIKYKYIFDAIFEFTESAFEVMLKDALRFQAFLSFLHLKDTYIGYVPMCQKKEKLRGFNQSKLIARIISEATEKEIIFLLIKIKDTQSQADLNKEERLKNVKDSFGVFSDSSFMLLNSLVYFFSNPLYVVGLITQ